MHPNDSNKKLIVANWKLNPQTLDEARSLASRVEHGLLAVDRSRVETVICPPFVFLGAVRHAIHFAKLGAQNVSRESGGAFTGDVSAGQLKEFGVKYIIVGHSERRRMGGVDDKVVSRKIKRVLSEDLEPILCVGFGTKKGFSDAAIKRIIKKQVLGGLAGLDRKKLRLTIAYEPVWAISQGLGTGRRAVTPAHAASVISYIKGTAPMARIIYGGSVDAKNAGGFAAEKVIEGSLVGGASLNAVEFLNIIKAFTTPSSSPPY